MHYYNDVDPFAAQWLRELQKEGALPEGLVDTTSIEDIKPAGLLQYKHCHFFAGIGGWPYALEQLKLPDVTIWTGSCPCQPFSAAGKGEGFADKRHLWPDWYWLISVCKPTIVFGEQVASKAADSWIDLVQTDMEALGYTFAAFALPAASVGAPHVRARIYWVAYTNSPDEERFGPFRVPVEPKQEPSRPGKFNNWAFDGFIRCTDRKARPIESRIQPLANGFAGRVGPLRGYGNSIVPQLAQAFVEEFFACLDKPGDWLDL